MRGRGLRLELLGTLSTAVMLTLAARGAPACAEAIGDGPITSNAALAELALGRLNATGKPITLTIPLRENGPLGQVQITITTDDKLSVSANDLTAALARVVRPADLARLKAAAGPSGQITSEAAAAAGFPLTYDSANIELAIAIPASARLTRVYTFGRESGEQAVLPDQSAKIAAYLNYRVGETYQFTGVNKGQSAYLADLELSGRLFNKVAFENFVTVDELADHNFVRTASRLIYDIPGPALRVTAGDLITSTTAFQSDPQIAGVNVSHLIDTFYPNTALAGNASRSLVLSRDSDVQILINNVPAGQIHLGPGSYDLRNLPIAQGANNVQAVIIDDTGQRRVQNFSFFSDISLLTPGINEYTASLGVLAPLGDDGPDYSRDGAFSGFYRRGITQQFTAGANAQASYDNQVLGVSGAFGTDFGLFSLDLAGNHIRTGDSGGAARLQYRYSDRTNSVYFARSFDFSIEYDSKYFSPLNSVIATPITTNFISIPGSTIPVTLTAIDISNFVNTQKLLVSGSLTQPLLRQLSLQVTGNYASSRGGLGDTGSLASFLTYQAPYSTTVGLGLRYQWAPRTDVQNTIIGRGLSAFLTLTHRFGAQSVASLTADRFQQRADFTRSPLRPTGDYFVNADAFHNDLGSSGDATVGYETTRGNIEGVYNASLNQGGAVTTQQAGAFFDGSIALAGTRIGLGRHITDAFAVIGEDPSLDHRQISIESRFANDVLAKSGFFGPAVLPTSSYNRQVIPYDVKDLPPGYNLGDGNFEVYPWLHSGFSLKVGSPYNITALGSLLNGDGQPLQLAVGSARSLTDPKAPTADVVTNRAGRFAIQGLEPGRYRIVMQDDPSLTYDVEVKRTPGMLVRFDAIKPHTP